MAWMQSFTVWPFIPAVVLFNLAYFVSGFAFWSAALTVSGIISLIYSYFRKLTVIVFPSACLITKTNLTRASCALFVEL